MTIPGVGRVQTHTLLDYTPLVGGRSTLGASGGGARYGAISAATPSNIDFGMLFTPPPSSLDNGSEDDGEEEEERRRLSYQPRPTPPPPASFGERDRADGAAGEEDSGWSQMVDGTTGPSPRRQHPSIFKPVLPAREPAPAPMISGSSSDIDSGSEESDELGDEGTVVTQILAGGVQPSPPREQPPPMAAARNSRRQSPPVAPPPQQPGGSTLRRFKVRGGGEFTVEPLMPLPPTAQRPGQHDREEVRLAADAIEPELY